MRSNPDTASAPALIAAADPRISAALVFPRGPLCNLTVDVNVSLLRTLTAVAIASQTCQLKHRFSSCRADAIGVCQYCGRAFCRGHGVLLEDTQQICERKVCVQKRQDIARHLLYKDIVLKRNAEGLCGLLDCGSGYAGVCSRCRGYFCERHLRPRDETVIENRSPVARRVSMCDHCWARRPLWLRM